MGTCGSGCEKKRGWFCWGKGNASEIQPWHQALQPRCGLVAQREPHGDKTERRVRLRAHGGSTHRDSRGCQGTASHCRGRRPPRPTLRAPAAGHTHRSRPGKALRRSAEAAAPHNGHRCTAPRRALNGRAPASAPERCRSPRAEEGQGRARAQTRVPALTCSPQPGEHLLPQICRRGAEGRRQLEMGSGQRAAAPPLPPGDHPALIAVVAAESGSAAFVTPPLAGARCWGARAAAASPFFCCCRLQ